MQDEGAGLAAFWCRQAGVSMRLASSEMELDRRARGRRLGGERDAVGVIRSSVPEMTSIGARPDRSPFKGLT